MNARPLPLRGHSHRGALALTAFVALSATAACSRSTGDVAPGAPPTSQTVPSVPVGSIPGHEGMRVDDTPKQGPRLLPAEAYMRSYLQLFGGLAPREAEAALRGGDDDALFDTWDDYLAALGLPDYRNEISRSGQTNALMVATFERLGVALCDRAVERDLVGPGQPPTSKRAIFAFDLPRGDVDDAGFAARFDVMHRRFLGYPATLAPATRVPRFLKLYRETVARHAAPGAARSRFHPAEAGWAAVCYGLVRHPEFHAY